MILKGSQRGGAAQLAAHLLKTEENEHVEIHELSGFVADDLYGALNEIYAVSRGTKCQQFMFSVSLNPPETEMVPIEYFEKAIMDIEQKAGLTDQPRAVVFHEKDGRRHCHAVWSRIDTDEMKAINLPHFKMKLQDVSKQLYFQYGWQMPRGFLNKEERNPLNYTLAEWQQAKRLDEDPKVLKQRFQDCWAASDSKDTFADALKEYGYTLARGDRRGFVLVDYEEEIFSLSRWIGMNNKQLKDRLGHSDALPSVDVIKVDMANQMTDQLRGYIKQIKRETTVKMRPLVERKRALVKHHREARATLSAKFATRWQEETITRSRRLPQGLKGIWFRITGKHQKIKAQNEQETESCRLRDHDEEQSLITRQLSERQKLQLELTTLKQEHGVQQLQLKQDIARYKKIGADSQEKIKDQLPERKNKNDPDYGPEM